MDEAKDPHQVARAPRAKDGLLQLSLLFSALFVLSAAYVAYREDVDMLLGRARHGAMSRSPFSPPPSSPSLSPPHGHTSANTLPANDDDDDDEAMQQHNTQGERSSALTQGVSRRSWATERQATGRQGDRATGRQATDDGEALSPLTPSSTQCSFQSYAAGDGHWNFEPKNDPAFGTFARSPDFVCPFIEKKYSCAPMFLDHRVPDNYYEAYKAQESQSGQQRGLSHGAELAFLQVAKGERLGRAIWTLSGCTHASERQMVETLFGQYDGRLLLFYGDSILRETFIALACSLVSRSDTYEWRKCSACAQEPGPHRPDWSPETVAHHFEYSGREPTRPGDAYKEGTGTFRWRGRKLRMDFIDEKEKWSGRDLIMYITSVGLPTTVVFNGGAREIVGFTVEGLDEMLSDALKLWRDLGKGMPLDFVFQETAATHFPTRDGDFMKGMYNEYHGSLKNNMKNFCVELSYSTSALAFETSINRRTEKVMERLGIPILRTWNMSMAASDAHVDNWRTMQRDCRHFCNPGVPSAWAQQLVYLLIEQAHGRTA